MNPSRKSIVLPLLQSDLVTTPTKTALQERLDDKRKQYQPAFFSESEFKSLNSICARLLGEPASPQGPQNAALQYTARQIDQRLTQRVTDGWRFDALPSDGEAYKLGIALLDHASSSAFATAFHQLNDEQIDQLLAAVEANTIAKAASETFDSALWFQELLAEVVECFYSHPEALDEIAYVGFSDAPGWNSVGMNQLAPREEAAKVEGK